MLRASGFWPLMCPSLAAPCFVLVGAALSPSRTELKTPKFMTNLSQGFWSLPTKMSEFRVFSEGGHDARPIF
jgi:hypothetical protein